MEVVMVEGVKETRMTTRTMTLKDGPAVCHLCPLEDEEGFDRARIVGGTFGRRGDILLKASDVTWEEATEELAPGQTALSPFDLELVQDVVTKLSYLPEGGLEALYELSEEAQVAWETPVDDAAYREAVARLLSQLTELPERKVDAGIRRRKVDAA